MRLDDCTNILYSSSVTLNRADICNIFVNIFAPVHVVQHVRETIYAVTSKRRDSPLKDKTHRRQCKMSSPKEIDL